MKKKDVDRFFSELSREWSHPTRILLIGGGEALLLGGARPTLDVDFEVKFLAAGLSWDEFVQAVQRVTARTGIGAQYSESIERWGELTLLDYRRHTRPVGVFGEVELRVLEPAYWSIGKMGRYWDQDIQDMIAVFKREKPDPRSVARVWARAIAQSPKSTQLMLSRRQALHFFKVFGKEIWGQAFSSEPIQKLFQTP